MIADNAANEYNTETPLGDSKDLLKVEMCPQNGEMKDDLSDCSIDMERVLADGANAGIGYRRDNQEDSACEPLRRFSKKVSVGDVHVGDYDNKAKLIDRISGGSFGEVYRGEFLSDENRPVAVKVEPQRGAAYCSFLLQEGAVYRNLEGGPGIPNVYWFGYHGSEYSALVMDLLGPTIYHQFRSNNNGNLSLKTMLMLTDQMIATLQHIHSHGYVHRDISPSNFVLGGEGNEKKLFLIDFGHAKKFTAGPAVFQRRNSSLPRAIVGTPRFISVHAHLSHQDAPRDDLEALGYMLVYLARGSLPWQGIQARSMPEKLNKIAEVKMNTPVEDICQGLPEEFTVFLNYARGLKLYECPDYDGIREMFKGLAAKLEINYEDGFDWDVKEDETADCKSTCPIKILDDECDDKNSPNISPVSR